MNKNESISSHYFQAISRIFSPIVMDNIADCGYSDYLSEVCKNSGLYRLIKPALSLGQFLDYVYSFLSNNYRTEYIYKNSIAKEILLKNHSLTDSTLINEFRVGRNKADVVVLNGTSSVYEIKTDYDSFVRLDDQLSTYAQIFEFVNVITSPLAIKKTLNRLPNNIGLLVLQKDNTLLQVKEPQSNIENIDLSIAFDSLRQWEYTTIIKNFFGYIPCVPNTKIFSECKVLFKSIPIETAHKLLIEILKKRNGSNYLGEFIKKAPKCLSSYAFSNACHEKKLRKLLPVLNYDLNSII